MRNGFLLRCAVASSRSLSGSRDCAMPSYEYVGSLNIDTMATLLISCALAR